MKNFWGVVGINTKPITGAGMAIQLYTRCITAFSMGRVVYSFSLPEESEAVWLLKKYKREGKVLSHVIQTGIEFTAKEIYELEAELNSYKHSYLKMFNILAEVFNCLVTDFNFYPKGHPKEAKLIPGVSQPIETLKMARDALKKRSEWIISGEDF